MALSIDAQKQKVLLEKAAHIAKVGYWQVDLLSNQVFWSDEIYTIHGLEKETYLPELESAINFYHPEDREIVRKSLEEAAQLKQGDSLRLRLIRADGEMRHVETSYDVELDEQGEAVSIFGVFRDVSEFYQIREELERSNKELENFAFTISHDLRTPLRHVTMAASFLETAVDERFTEEEANFLKIMTDGAEKAQFMIENLLDYSRIGRAKSDLQNLDLNVLINGVLSLLTFSIEESEADINLGEMPTIYGNEGLIMRLFQNLFENSLKYKKEDQAPKIKITAAQNNNMHVITFQDTGIGIDPKHKDTIFKLFQRLHGSEDKYEGVGIGLAICQRIMAVHKGYIELDTDYQGGARFALYFPLTARDA